MSQYSFQSCPTRENIETFTETCVKNFVDMSILYYTSQLDSYWTHPSYYSCLHFVDFPLVDQYLVDLALHLIFYHHEGMWGVVCYMFYTFSLLYTFLIYVLNQDSHNKASFLSQKPFHRFSQKYSTDLKVHDSSFCKDCIPYCLNLHNRQMTQNYPLFLSKLADPWLEVFCLFSVFYL